MSKVFWATFNWNTIRHLWRWDGGGLAQSACGLKTVNLKSQTEGDKCKNCLRAIKR